MMQVCRLNVFSQVCTHNTRVCTLCAISVLTCGVLWLWWCVLSLVSLKLLALQHPFLPSGTSEPPQPRRVSLCKFSSQQELGHSLWEQGGQVGGSGQHQPGLLVARKKIIFLIIFRRHYVQLKVMEQNCESQEACTVASDVQGPLNFMTFSNFFICPLLCFPVQEMRSSDQVITKVLVSP